MTNKIKKNIFWLILLVAGSAWILSNNLDKQKYHKIQGSIFGTIYAITYQYDKDIQPDVTKELDRIDLSLSPFKEQSIISKVNRNEEVELDTLFINVFKRAQEISKISDGAFDITVAPLVNAWGFGFKKGEFPDSLIVDSLLQYIGYEKIALEKGKIIKENPEIILDCSAIAKGYAVDVIGDLLESKGIKNYMIDIGGEILTKGKNSKGDSWRIGINKPSDDSLSNNQELELIVKIENKALATSGNYRNYYVKDGKKYAHTISPKTGYPVQHSILSSTVLANDCMTADALATAFMVVGLDEAKAILQKVPHVEACFIYTEETSGEYKTFLTEGFKTFVAN